MKIRNGFVSNSSSSSFIVIYKNNNDFAKFDRFEGYNTFMNDLDNQTIDEAKKSIIGVLNYYCWKTHDKFTYDDENVIHHDDFVFYDYFNFLFKTSQVDKKEFNDVIAELNVKGFEFWNRNRGKRFDYTNPEYKTYAESYYNNEKAIDDKMKEIGTKIADGLIKNGYQIGWMRYHDDTDEGCYMEHYFMPFLSMNPERQYSIISLNEH